MNGRKFHFYRSFIIFPYLTTIAYAFRRPQSHQLMMNAWKGLELVKAITKISNAVDQEYDVFYSSVKLKEKKILTTIWIHWTFTFLSCSFKFAILIQFGHIKQTTWRLGRKNKENQVSAQGTLSCIKAINLSPLQVTCYFFNTSYLNRIVKQPYSLKYFSSVSKTFRWCSCKGITHI